MRSGRVRAKPEPTLGNPDGNAMVDFGRGRSALLACLIGLLALLPRPLSAQEAATYTVTDIAVDATAGDAVAARTSALAQGQREGLARLLRRLTPSEEHDRLPSLAGVPIEPYVQNFSIEEEELSGTRYLASLTVTYDPTAVKDLLRDQGLSFTETASAPVLVLPLYVAGEGTPRLWPEDNPWWEAWAETLDPNGLLRLTLPLGDLEDITQLAPEQVTGGDRDAMLALAARYGADDVLIARATPVADGAAVRLDAERLGQTDRSGAPFTLEARQGQGERQLLEVAARRLQQSLAERWKQGNLLSFDQSGRMLVDVPIRDLADWVWTSGTLEAMPEVDRVEVVQFSREAVRAQIGYMGDEFRLEEALYRQGLMLSREGETWQLLQTGANPPGPGSGRSASSSGAPPSISPIPLPSGG